MISLRTLIWFIVLTATTVTMVYRIRERNRPCIEWQNTHNHGQQNAASTDQKSDEALEFNPCGMLE